MVDKNLCNICWWREGDSCYNEKIANVKKEKLCLVGQKIDEELINICFNKEGFKNKRFVLNQIIPNDKLIIISEENLKNG